jgi:hypothetical protein
MGGTSAERDVSIASGFASPLRCFRDTTSSLDTTSA